MVNGTLSVRFAVLGSRTKDYSRAFIVSTGKNAPSRVPCPLCHFALDRRLDHASGVGGRSPEARSGDRTRSLRPHATRGSSVSRRNVGLQRETERRCRTLKAGISDSAGRNGNGNGNAGERSSDRRSRPLIRARSQWFNAHEQRSHRIDAVYTPQSLRTRASLSFGGPSAGNDSISRTVASTALFGFPPP